jgi:hypothetical protein
MQMQARRGAQTCLLARLNSQSFSTFCPPAVKDEPAAFGGHADKEAMGSFPACITNCFQRLFHLFKPLLSI